MLSKSAVGCRLSLCVAKHMPEVIFHLLEQFLTVSANLL